ncbi:MAG: electron transport complex subunit RsxC [bacterium]|nr:electron transport complex subunit RsxC [bacterium]
MTRRTFAGGVHVPEHKDATGQLPIEDLALPGEVFVPLLQHTGAPCRSLVEVGQRVLKGQKIGDADAFVTAPVHSPVTGTVKAVEERLIFNHRKVEGVAITTGPAADQAQTAFMEAVLEWQELKPEAIVRIVREAGLAGLGGAAFPTHVKLSPKDKRFDTLIINGCECEPFLTCDHRLLLERTEAIVTGILILKHVTGAGRVIVGIEDNKPDAIEAMKAAVSGHPGMAVEVLETRYPQGAEKQLIKALLNREVPPGGLPMDVGALVHNVGTAIAVAEAVTGGKPLIERVLTVGGPGIVRPANVRVAIGTPISDVIAHAGGLRDGVTRVVMGGPMTGWAQDDLSVPVVKGTSGILALDESLTGVAVAHEVCVRCGRCVQACPQLLYPNFLGTTAEHGDWSRAEAEGALDCVECGVCAYVCPGHRPLVRFVREAKAAIMARRK